MEHVVELTIRRFFKAYVADEKGDMTESEIIEAAKKMALDGIENIVEDLELTEIEKDDILDAEYEYDV